MTALDDRIPSLLDRVTIQKALGERGHEPARHGPLSDLYHCPLPGHEDHEPSFAVRARRWKCWSQCDRAGDVIDLVSLLDGISTAEAIDRLAARCGLARTDHPGAPTEHLSPTRTARLLEGYLAGRGWDAEAAGEMGLSVVLDQRGRPRVRFPYIYGAELIWWQDRAIGDASPKWLSPKAQRPAIYNADALRLARERDGELWVVEGPSDTMALLSTYESPAVVGIPGAGNFSRDWVPAFSDLRQVVVAGDNDQAGQKFRARVRELLAPVVGRISDLYVPQPYNDLDDWRRACGTDGSRRFGEALQEAAAAAERPVAA